MLNPQNHQQPLSTLDHAIALGKQGYKVFPCVENGKIPAVGGWQHRATSDEAEIRKMWTRLDPVLGGVQVRNYNIGISTVGLLVLDVDTKEGKPGLRSLDELDTIYGFPSTFTVRTTSGGLHLYFRPINPVGNSASKIGAGLDVRGNGGYVLGPGSTIDGKAYEITHAIPVAQAPDWLEAGAGAPAKKAADQRHVVDFLDTPAAVQRAIDYLSRLEPEMTAGNAYTPAFRTAARCKDFGVSELTCLQLMENYWNGIKRIPAIEFEKLAFKVSNAYKYGKNPVGAESAQADFDKVELTVEKPKDRPKLYRRKFGEIKPRLTETALVSKLLSETAMSVVYGESNTGKTFFAMAVAYAIAAGVDFAQRKVVQGPVVYVAAEAGVSAENRIAALREKYGEAKVPFDLVPCPVDLLRHDGDTKPLIDLIHEAAKDHGAPVRLVVIDTLSRAISGGNENSPDDMGALVKHLDAIRVSTGAHVMVVHHSGKDKAKGARGHSLLRAATDTEIEIADGIASITKQRDMEFGQPIPFDLETVELGTTPQGDEVTSCVCVPMKQGAVEDFGGDPARINLMVEALAAAVKANGGKAVTWNYWREVCTDYINTDVEDGGNRGKWPNPFNSRLKALRTIRDSRGLRAKVKKIGADQWVTGQ